MILADDIHTRHTLALEPLAIAHKNQYKLDQLIILIIGIILNTQDVAFRCGYLNAREGSGTPKISYRDGEKKDVPSRMKFGKSSGAPLTLCIRRF